MQATIDTLGDVIFEKKETVKKLTEERDALLRKLLTKQQTIDQLQEKVSCLSMERQHLLSQRLPHGEDTCNMALTDKPASELLKYNPDCGGALSNKRRD